MMMRRRPLLAAAVVGGTAYHMGKKGQQSRDQEADQNAQIADLQAQQQQQQAPPPAAAAPAPAADEDPMAKLTQLKSLLDQGVLTQAEFDFQKTKILQSM
jgi:membrane protease subunit (stomatin/prohibitin family)